MVMSVGGATFRQVMGQFATGVTIVTTRAGEMIHGMTVNAFTSLSLDPPLVLICIDQTARTKPVLDAGGVFAINVLAEDQIEISRLFAAPNLDADADPDSDADSRSSRRRLRPGDRDPCRALQRHAGRGLVCTSESAPELLRRTLAASDLVPIHGTDRRDSVRQYRGERLRHRPRRVFRNMRRFERNRLQQSRYHGWHLDRNVSTDAGSDLLLCDQRAAAL